MAQVISSSGKRSYDKTFILHLMGEIKNREDIGRVAHKYAISFATVNGWYLRFVAYGPEDFAVKIPPKKKEPISKEEKAERLRRIFAQEPRIKALEERIAVLERQFAMSNSHGQMNAAAEQQGHALSAHHPQMKTILRPANNG